MLGVTEIHSLTYLLLPIYNEAELRILIGMGLELQSCCGLDWLNSGVIFVSSVTEKRLLFQMAKRIGP